MLLAYRAKGYFDVETRQRGDYYFKAGRVSSPEIKGDEFVAVVTGSDIYNIRLKWLPTYNEKLNLFASCTCPHFRKENLCKHIWAGIQHASYTDFGKKASTFGMLSASFSSETSETSSARQNEDDFDYGVKESRFFSKSKNRKQKWQSVFAEALTENHHQTSVFQSQKERWAYYIFEHNHYNEGLQLSCHFREKNKNGELGSLKPFRLRADDISLFQNPLDQKILTTLFDVRRSQYSDGREIIIPPAIVPLILPSIIETNRARFGTALDSSAPSLKLDPEVFELQYELILSEEAGRVLTLNAFFKSSTQRIDLDQVIFTNIHPHLFFTKDIVAFFNPDGPRQLFEYIQANGSVQCSERDFTSFVERLLSLEFRNFPTLPTGLGWKEEASEVQAILRLHSNPQIDFGSIRSAEVLFKYASRTYSYGEVQKSSIDKDNKTVFVRNQNAENEKIALLKSVATFQYGKNCGCAVLIPSSEISKAVSFLSANGWEVHVEKNKLIHADNFKIEVSSGMDWFDVGATVKFGEEEYTLPEILKNLEANGGWVRLKSDELGLLPDAVVKKYLLMKNLGEASGGKLRFKNQQALLMEGLFQEGFSVAVDQHFSEIANKLKSFKEIKSIPTPKKFKGKLRKYQKDGLSWLSFLNDMGFGGCLADDMGLGKTIQVLALLQHVSDNSKNKKPHLIVVPKSLIYNWQEETKKFLPHFKVAVHAGANRSLKNISNYDVVLVTYHTLRNDIEDFLTQDFGYVILDEAQAIKNASSLASKAVKLLNPKNRLALTGTPIENHFGDILSIFQFLNPGLFANKALANANLTSVDENMKLVLQALRPFILRRTKDEVLKELPSKTEQVLFCEMSSDEKKEYDRLKEYYRVKLNQTVEEKGFNNSKIMILEALLRLRQLACHSGLIDPEEADASSAKLDVLFEHVSEILDSGHKLLVFSQFTKLLGIVSKKMKASGYTFAYLDGKTKDRQGEVERFQTDPNCKIFLISLKAGGVGLNLTAADYCFLLDPWWNPAVEAQAIDRIHRIGQKNKVMAYRLITKGTVEEKVLELQSHKKQLSQALLASDQSFLKKLKLEDIKWILE